MKSNLKFGKQCVKAVKAANRVIRMIERTFVYLSKDFDLTWSIVYRHGDLTSVRIRLVGKGPMMGYKNDPRSSQ